jgi:protein-tyrosine phosphatase
VSTQFFRIDGPWPGILALSARPRGGDWLADEIRNWRSCGFDEIVSLLTPDEVQEMELHQEPEISRQNHMQFISFPIADRNVPDSRTAALRLLERLGDDLARGKNINIHCRQGIGRSAMIAAGLLIATGMSPSEAVRKIAAARRSPVPETPEQLRWIESLAISLAPPKIRA